ncbi:hypothetical protein BCR43DRAFT_481908 [Syncephalastrum racemosum]|uniref:Uncharacterized protein n=1 Tax=Syncephalastrum racemosum TaxID=13706 RepID=A0A1X2HST3_SYNRA|nr:hypothetical protein BCR43DRAFT_481908 [Syncephalastrum racemosum]
MDLNICLYCETRLPDESTSFCSVACEAQEAAKSYSARPEYYFPKVNTETQITQSLITKTKPTTTAYSPPMVPSSYSMSYHRRRSFYYSREAEHVLLGSASTSSLSSLESAASSASSTSSTASFESFSKYNMHFYSHNHPAFVNNFNIS